MSHKTIPKFCLVIDASVARAAGDRASKHPTGIACREYLMAVRSICHRMAWGQSLQAEWNNHQSTFAATWLVSMKSMGKLLHVNDNLADELRQRIEQAADASVVAIMRKDSHLLAADRRIVSLDETVRTHFSSCLTQEPDIVTILWVNPTTPEEAAIDWLERGAPTESKRQLKPR